MMIGSLLVTVLLAGSPLKLNGDNISQIVNELTTEEKAALLVGSGAKAFDGVGYTTLYVKGSAGTTHPIERLGIPAIVLADGPAESGSTTAHAPSSRSEPPSTPPGIHRLSRRSAEP